MPNTGAGIGYGSLVEMTDAANPVTWTYLGEAKSINLPADTIDQVDATHMQSPNRTREFIPGLVDPGEFSFEQNYIPGSASDVALTAAKGQQKTIRVTFPNGRQVIFNGSLQSYEKTAPLDDVKVATVTFKVSGAPTLTAVTAPRNITLPVIEGTAQVGVPLKVDWGVWAGAETFTFQWQADTAGDGVFVDIVGATDTSYVPVVADVGNDIRVEVTAANDDFSTAANSAETTAVVAA